MEEYVREINQRLILLETPTRIVDWYSTGNFVVQSPITNRWMIADELSLAFGVPCTVQTTDEVASCVSIAEKFNAECTGDKGIRWTKGIAFEVKGKPCTVALKPTPYAVFFHINRFAVGVNKAERFNSLETEDRSEGWGAISEEISKQVSGTWTARSLTRLKGVIVKARTHDKSKHTVEGYQRKD
jgi:hypothetical protein